MNKALHKIEEKIEEGCKNIFGKVKPVIEKDAKEVATEVIAEEVKKVEEGKGLPSVKSIAEDTVKAAEPLILPPKEA